MKRPLLRIEIKTMIRILETINKPQLQKRTEIANACNMNYERFIQYVDILTTLEILTVYNYTKKIKTVKITNRGKNILKDLQKTYHSDAFH